MSWSVVIIAVFVAGFVEFWRLCRTAPLMIDEGLEPVALERDALERPREQGDLCEDPCDAGVALGSETLVPHLTTALNVAGDPTPQMVRKPVEAR